MVFCAHCHFPVLAKESELALAVPEVCPHFWLFIVIIYSKIRMAGVVGDVPAVPFCRLRHSVFCTCNSSLLLLPNVLSVVSIDGGC